MLGDVLMGMAKNEKEVHHVRTSGGKDQEARGY